MKIKFKSPHLRLQIIRDYINYCVLCVKSLCYNEHLSQAYLAGKIFSLSQENNIIL